MTLLESSPPLWLIPLLFLPAFLLMWLFVNYILYRASWIHLQRNFRYTGTVFPGRRIGSVYVRIRNVQYKNVLSFYFDHQGMYIKPFVLFGMFSKPLFIPWTEITSIREERFFINTYTTLQVGKSDPEKIKILRRSFKKMENEFREYLPKMLFNNLS